MAQMGSHIEHKGTKGTNEALSPWCLERSGCLKLPTPNRNYIEHKGTKGSKFSVLGVLYEMNLNSSRTTEYLARQPQPKKESDQNNSAALFLHYFVPNYFDLNRPA